MGWEAHWNYDSYRFILSMFYATLLLYISRHVFFTIDDAERLGVHGPIAFMPHVDGYIIISSTDTTPL